MRSRTKEFFYCEYCGKEFSDEYECASHEGSHLKDFSYSTRKEIASELINLSESARDYRCGETVMGMPIDNFKSLMKAAAKKIAEGDEE